MLKNLFYLLILLLGIPTGIILEKINLSEIKVWKKQFIIISFISLIIAVGIFFINFEYKISVIISLFFIIIVNLSIVLFNNYKRQF